jgi:hypothetical protein
MRARYWSWLVVVVVAQGCDCGSDGGSLDAGSIEDAGADAAQDSGTEPDAEVDAGQDAAAPDAETLDVFEAWQEAREALKASPDHLPARAAALIEAGDPEAIFEFVRDHIATYPSSAGGFQNTPDAIRWGVRGTLRGGAGSAREKAELLAFMLTEAGFSARVVQGAPDPERIDGQKMVLRSTTRAFAPVIDPERGELWLDALGQASPNEPPQRSSIDADGEEARALADALLAQLPAELEASFDFDVAEIPLVSLDIDGEPTYLNPLVPDAEYGEALTLADPIPAGPMTPSDRLLVKVSAGRANAPYERVTLVEREYTSEEVVGRRIQLSFRPPTPIAQLLRSRVDSFETFLPIITVSAPGLEGEEKDDLAAIGDAVSIGGEIYHLDEDGNLTVNGAPLAEGTSDPDEIARVETVAVNAEPAAFPRVTLRVQAQDADGVNVEHLDASAFTVTEDGEPVSFNVVRNEAPPPRIAIIFDISTSVPMEFLGAGTVAVAQDIIAGLYAASPEADVRLGVISFGTTWMGPWMSNEADANLQAASLETANGGSEIWNALRDAAEEDPTLIIMLTDGVPSEPALEQDYDAIAAGPPVLALGFSAAVDYDPATLDQIAALSGGSAAPITDAMSAIDASVAAIEDSLQDSYVFTYAASEDGGDARDVTVTVNDVTAETTYDVPETPVTPPAISGLYLTIRTPGGELTRALAGFDRGYTTGPQSISQQMLDDVRAMLYGRVSISVEAASPAPSIVLDDWIAEKLQIQPLYEAFADADEAKVLEALEEGFTITPPKLPLAHPPLPGASSQDSLTFETGLRLATMVQKTFEDGPITRSLDLFPLTRFATATEDPRAAFERTMEATAGLAVMEAGMFEGTSTLEALENEELTLVTPGDARYQVGLSDEEQLQWAALEEPFGVGYSLLVPLKPGPFWAIDQTTGTVIGVLADGTGGASEDACGTHDALNNFLELFGLLGSLFEQGAFGPWIALAQWEVKYVTIATIVISGGSPNGDTDLTNPAGDMGCAIIDGMIGDAVPGYGTYNDLVNTLKNHGMDTGAPTLCGGGDGPC